MAFKDVLIAHCVLLKNSPVDNKEKIIRAVK